MLYEQMELAIQPLISANLEFYSFLSLRKSECPYTAMILSIMAIIDGALGKINTVLVVHA